MNSQNDSQTPRKISDRIRRSQGRLARNSVAAVKVNLDERHELDEAARRSGKAFSEWGREVLLSAARDGLTQTAVFTELIALRVVVNKILKRLALGETMTEEQFEKVMSDTKRGKHDAATDVLSQYSKPEGEQQ